MIKRNWWLILIVLFAPYIVVSAQTAEKTTESSDAELARVIRERVEVGKTNQSIVIAIIDNKNIRFVSDGKLTPTAARKANEETVFEIGSVTKVFTGTLLAIAVERGEVALDDPISKYLPKEVKTPSFNGREITLLDLATQSSGLPGLPTNFAPQNPANPYADYTVARMYSFLSSYQMTRAPGEKYQYSNFGMGLLGHILALCAEVSYEDLVKARILKPLGMNETTITLAPVLEARMASGFDQNGDPAANWHIPTLAGAGALRSTAKDLAKFVQANLNGSSPLAISFVRARTAQRAASGEMKIGLAWHLLPSESGDIVWHNGGTGGYRSFAGFNVAQNKGIVILTNTAESVDDIGFHFLKPQSPLRKVAPMISLSSEVLDKYVGIYQFAPNVFLTITRRDNRLFAQLTGQEALRIFPSAQNEFYFRAVEARLTFNRNADGQTESVTLHQNGDQVARKVK